MCGCHIIAIIISILIIICLISPIYLYFKQKHKFIKSFKVKVIKNADSLNSLIINEKKYTLQASADKAFMNTGIFDDSTEQHYEVTFAPFDDMQGVVIARKAKYENSESYPRYFINQSKPVMICAQSLIEVFGLVPDVFYVKLIT